MKLEVDIPQELHEFLKERAKGLTAHRVALEDGSPAVTVNDVVRLLIQRFRDEVS